jgi:probable phosphoglycerate mutase
MQRPDIPLNEIGVAQAARLAPRLIELGFVHVLCSDLTRARMTAAPLVAHAAVHGIAIEDTPLLQERNFGDIRGTPYAELGFDPYAPDYEPPNGESIPVFHRRVAEAFALIAERRRGLAGNLVVITHGLVCRAIADRHARCREVPEQFDNTSLTVLDPDPPHAATLINCTRHLVDAQAGAAGAAPGRA